MVKELVSPYRTLWRRTYGINAINKKELRMFSGRLNVLVKLSGMDQLEITICDFKLGRHLQASLCLY